MPDINDPRVRKAFGLDVDIPLPPRPPVIGQRTARHHDSRLGSYIVAIGIMSAALVGYAVGSSC